MRSDLQEKYPAGLAAADRRGHWSFATRRRTLAAGGRSFEAENVFVVAAGKAPKLDEKARKLLLERVMILR